MLVHVTLQKAGHIVHRPTEGGPLIFSGLPSTLRNNVTSTLRFIPVFSADLPQLAPSTDPWNAMRSDTCKEPIRKKRNRGKVEKRELNLERKGDGENEV